MYVSKYRLDIFLAAVLISTLIFHYTKTTDNSILIAVAIIGFMPVLFGAYNSLRNKEWQSMSLLASIALLLALLNQEWASAIFIELMLAAARILESATQDRTEKNLKSLLKLRPNVALVERDGGLISIPAKDIRVGDTVIVGIEERIPVDGVILSGSAAIDESSITGESLPVDKNMNDLALSSTLIKSGSLRIRTTRIGKDTTLEKIIGLIESARNQKPQSQTMGEKFGKIYLTSVFVISVIIYLMTHNLQLVLAIVLVVCADDIAIAIPIAYLEAIRKAASLGIIVKSARHLEILDKIKTVVFDKTGTLTTGNLNIVDIIPSKTSSREELFESAIIGSLESHHPIAKAMISYSKDYTPDHIPETIEEKGGKGIIARYGNNIIVFGKEILIKENGINISQDLKDLAEKSRAAGFSVSFVAKNNIVLGFITAADHAKENAKETISELHSLGVRKAVMLTGDNEKAAKMIANKTGIDEWYANLLPEDKVTIIKKLEYEESVAMVGDGINDAAALSIANVGIAMGGRGMEGTIDSAQLVLMRDDLSTIPKAIRIGRIARQISIQDFWIWGISNVIGLTLVFAGIIGPTGAAAYNFISDFFPLINSLRISSMINRHNQQKTP